MKTWLRIGYAPVLLAVLGCSLARAQSATGPAPYLNPALALDVRVDDLISRMTLEEKASQLVNRSRGIPRLRVPAYDWWSEGLHGVARAGVATVFPEPIGLAATWDTPLLHRIGEVIGTEARAKYRASAREGSTTIYHGLTFWSPNINIFRDPRWGRGQETYGEDPFLTSSMGLSFVTGMQGDDPKYLRVVATPKHFAVHSGPEPSRHDFNAVVSRRDMEDTYLPAFRTTVTQGNAGSVMCAYNAVNGEPACANRFLLQDQLRGEWNFEGYVVSDCDAITDIQTGHHYAKTVEEAAAVSLKRGTDLECADYIDPPQGNSDYVKYIAAVKRGLLSEKEIDRALRRLLRARFRLGMFDPPEMVPYAQIPITENDTSAHRELALEAARESMVLLKNNGVLPLRRSVRRVAVVGPLADSERVLLGNYHGTPSRATTALRGIHQQFPAAKVTFVPGTDFLNQYPVPTDVLAARPGQAGTGLKAEYFDNPEPSGVPVLTRNDPLIDFDSGESPMPSANGKRLSVRWTGQLVPAYSGKYELGVQADDSFRLLLDGKLLLDNRMQHAGQQPGETRLVPVALEYGHTYPLRLEYLQHGSGTVAKLIWSPGGKTIADAVQAARDAEVVIAVVGITSDLEGEEMEVKVEGFSGGDGTHLDLPAPEEEILRAVKSTGKPLIVVLMNGSALAVNWAQQNADAILEGWYPGEEGGTAIGETLVGSNNPAGRLPVTFYTSTDQLPPFDDYSMKNKTYRYFKGNPLYGFGYGLSYSTFEYRNLEIDAGRRDGSIGVGVEVTNTSSRAGDEVVELYLVHPSSRYPAPLRALRGLQRIHLQAHDTQKVRFTLTHEQLMAPDDRGKEVLEPGEFRLSLGGRQPDDTTRSSRQSVEGTFVIGHN